MTSLGSDIAWYALRSAWCMDLGTGPVINKASAKRGDATTLIPNLSISKIELHEAATSKSQAEQPVDTTRMANERLKKLLSGGRGLCSLCGGCKRPSRWYDHTAVLRSGTIVPLGHFSMQRLQAVQAPRSRITEPASRVIAVVGQT